MRPLVLARKVHYWSTLVIALPILLVLVTGLLLQVKKQWTWVQPEEQIGTPTENPITLAESVAIMRNHGEIGIEGWDDIDRFDVRPSKGMMKIRLNDGREVQINLSDGRILQIDYRRTDLIESLHDGSWFGGDISKLGLFLPAATILLMMWITGIWMFWAPIPIRRKRHRARLDKQARHQTTDGSV
jgi:uncharacterized iron-regulated membrane protein